MSKPKRPKGAWYSVEETPYSRQLRLDRQMALHHMEMALRFCRAADAESERIYWPVQLVSQHPPALSGVST